MVKWHAYDNILTEDFLQTEYTDNMRSIAGIAKEVGCSQPTVLSYLQDYGIKRRPVGQKSKPYGLINVDGVMDYLDGLMVSDGCLVMNGSKSAYYVQPCIYKGWLEDIQSYFGEHGIESSIIHRFNNGRSIYQLRTLSYPEFKDQRERWYPNGGKKEVPKEDVSLSPRSVSNWMMGDGTLSKQYGWFKFYTNSFLKSDTEFLAEILSYQIGIEARVHVAKKYDNDQRGYMLYIPRRDVSTLVDYVFPYIHPDFYYKIAIY